MSKSAQVHRDTSVAVLPAAMHFGHEAVMRSELGTYVAELRFQIDDVVVAVEHKAKVVNDAHDYTQLVLGAAHEAVTMLLREIEFLSVDPEQEAYYVSWWYNSDTLTVIVATDRDTDQYKVMALIRSRTIADLLSD